MCVPLQGEIVTKGVAREIKGEKVKSLSDYGYGTPAGCLGINCGHYLTPFVVGVNYKPRSHPYIENLTPEEARQNALDMAKYKAYERELKVIRDKKRLAKELNDKEYLEQLRARERTLKAGKKHLVEKNPTAIGKYPSKSVVDNAEKVYNKSNRKATPIIVKSVKEAQDFFAKQTSHKNMISSLNKEEKTLLRYYTLSEHEYYNKLLRKGVNSYLNSFGTMYVENREYYVQRETKRMNDLINLGNKISKYEVQTPFKVYRSFPESDFNITQELKKGDIIREKGFLSTSLLKSVTDDFKSEFGNNVLYEITMKKGDKVGGFISELSDIPEEVEFLIKPNTTFKVISEKIIEEKNGSKTRLISLEVVE